MLLIEVGHDGEIWKNGFFSSLYASIQHMHDTLETSEDRLKQRKKNKENEGHRTGKTPNYFCVLIRDCHLQYISF